MQNQPFKKRGQLILNPVPLRSSSLPQYHHHPRRQDYENIHLAPHHQHQQQQHPQLHQPHQLPQQHRTHLQLQLQQHPQLQPQQKLHQSHHHPQQYYLQPRHIPQQIQPPQSILPSQHIQPPQQNTQYKEANKISTTDSCTQIDVDDFPPSPPSNELVQALEKIKQLEELLEAQNQLINQLSQDKCRTQTPPQDVPNSTTITPSPIEYEDERYLVEHEEEASESSSISIDLSNGGVPTQKSHSTSMDSGRPETYISEETQLAVKSSYDNGFSLENVGVSIGPNGTMIPALAYDSMSWSSAAHATRKLLVIIFDEETLATNNISPAFCDMDPSLGQLDPAAIQDIIFCVTKKCGVLQNEVLAAIALKCAEENQAMKTLANKRKNSQGLERPILKECNRTNTEYLYDESI